MRPFSEILTECIDKGVGLPLTGPHDPDPSWTRKELCSEIGVNASTLRGWENGVLPKNHNFIALRKMLTPQPSAPLCHRELYNELVEAFLVGQSDVPPIPNNNPESVPTETSTKRDGTPPGCSDSLHAPPAFETKDQWPGPVTAAAGIALLALLLMSGYVGTLVSWLVAGSTILLLFTWFFEASLRSAGNREFVAEFFEKDRYSQAYKTGLSALLDASDNWLLDKSLREAGRDNAALKTTLAWAWPIRLYAFAILVASLYPMTMMFWQWIGTDQHVMFGESFLLLSTTNLFFQLLPVKPPIFVPAHGMR